MWIKLKRGSCISCRLLALEARRDRSPCWDLVGYVDSASNSLVNGPLILASYPTEYQAQKMVDIIFQELGDGARAIDIPRLEEKYRDLLNQDPNSSW